MPELRKPLSFNPQSVSKNTRTKAEPMKKIRIIYDDPDATDSSDDERAGAKRMKRVVREVRYPIGESCGENSSALDSKNGDKITKKRSFSSLIKSKPSQGCNGKYRGIRQRKWGKWAAEIRHPIEHKRVWLGTYNTAEEASRAYELKRLEFESLVNTTEFPAGKRSSMVVSEPVENTKQAVSPMSVDSSESAVSLTSLTSPLSVLEMNSLTSSSLVCDVVDQEVARVNSLTSPSLVCDVVDQEVAYSELKLADHGVMDEELMALAQLGLDFELDTLDFNDDLFSGLDIPCCGFDDLDDEPFPLPDFDLDFELDNGCDDLDWMDDGADLMNGAALNIACP